MVKHMTKYLTVGLLSVVTFGLSSSFIASEAEAQPARCTNHTNLTSHLEKKYGEKPRGIGLVSEQGVMQVYVSKKGTWTILVTNPQGQACLLAAGKGWEDLKISFEDPEA